VAKRFHVVNGCCVNHRDAGAPVTQVRDDIYLVDIIARATDEQRVSLSTLRDLQVPLPGGRTVPLSQVATFEYAQDYPGVWRRDRVPTLTVQADVAPGALPKTVIDSLASIDGSANTNNAVQDTRHVAFTSPIQNIAHPSPRGSMILPRHLTLFDPLSV
jgi:multidrug efflux pump subunit AcrB